jgi:NAD(P)-dependent dehydrogenase (short-subunit alcohol dehydrogenase family)
MPDSSRKKVAAVVGVGPGLGASVARRFAAGYAVALIARRADCLNQVAVEIQKEGREAIAVPADAGSSAEISKAFRTVRERLGDPEVMVYNAAAGPFGALADIAPEQFENSMRINALGAFMCAKECAPAMIARGHGVMLFTGATAGVKAGAKSAAFGPGNFAKRGLAQSLARDLGPKGIHVAWINVDGSIDIPGRKIPGKTAEDMLSPDAIAESYWHLAHQDPSAWTMELDLRPFKEKF